MQFKTSAEWAFEDFKRYRDNRADLEISMQRSYEMFNRTFKDKSWKHNEGEAWRSTTYVGKARQKTMALYSILIDMVLAGGKLPMMLKPAPMTDTLMGETPDQIDTLITSNIEAVQNRIEQQNAETRVERDVMRILMSLGKYGIGWGKKSISQIVRQWYSHEIPAVEETQINFQRIPDRFKVWVPKQKSVSAPDLVAVSAWSMFWDSEDPDLQMGEAVWQEELCSAYWLRQRMGRAMYDDVAIESVLSTLSGNDDQTTATPATDRQDSLPPRFRNLKNRAKRCMVRERWGRVPSEQAKMIEDKVRENAASKGTEDYDIPVIKRLRDDWHPNDEKPGDDVECMMMIASTAASGSEQIIRYARVQPGIRPYLNVVMEDDIDSVGGIGIPENCAELEKVYVGIVRAIEDNGRLSSNLGIATKDRWMENPEKLNTLEPGFHIHLTDDCPSASDAVQAITFPNVAQQLYPMLQMLDVLFDEESMMAKTMQGQMQRGDNTAYEISQLVEKAGKYIGAIIKNIDEQLIEPFGQYCYDYAMMDPDVQAKGNFTVQALGFSSFQDRVTRISNIMRLLQLGMSSPILANELKLRWILEEIAKALDLDPKQALKSEEEKALEQQQAQAMAAQQAQMQAQPPPPQPPSEAETAKIQIEAVKVKGDLDVKNKELDLKRAELLHNMKQAKIKDLEALDRALQPGAQQGQPTAKVSAPRPPRERAPVLPGESVLQ